MKLFAVFGNPIAHSKSPTIHHLFAQQCRHQVTYQARLAEVGQFSQAIATFVAEGGEGCNVTVPFKQDAFELADKLSSYAKAAGAVNTLQFLDGEVVADNTDGRGLIADFDYHDVELAQKRILLIGAGGAARGVLLPLLERNPSKLIITNRTASKAEQLAKLAADYKGNSIVCWSGLAELKNRPFDIVINASSAGLSQSVPDIDANIINADTICYDMVYGKGQTAFNQWAHGKGAKHCIDGLGMLVEQAALSYQVWMGEKPATELVRQTLRAELS